MKSYLLSAIVCLALSLSARGQSSPSEFENEGLWEWALTPVPVEVKDVPASQESTDERMQLVAFCELESLTVAAQMVSIGDAVPLLITKGGGDARSRLVAFDEDRNRLEFAGGGSCSFPGARLGMRQVRLGDKRLKYLGVEQLTPAKQKLHAATAQEKLLKNGVVLSYPIEGESFPYRFGSPAKAAIDSKQYLGEVVLMQWWASW